MRNFANILSYLPKRVSALLLSLVFVGLPLVVVQATGSGEGPIFNSFTNAYYDGQYIGDERDFLRVAPGGNTNYTDSVEVCEGKVDVWFYIHNNQDPEHNGSSFDGPGVAQDTKVRLAVPSPEADSHKLVSMITASNASTVVDSAYITCNGHQVTLDYVEGSAEGYSFTRGTFPISDSIVSSPTLVGSYADNGEVPGCWEYRIFIKVTIEVKKKEVPQPIYNCDALSAITVDRNTRKFKADASVDNGAEVVSYGFDFENNGSVDQTVTTSALTATSNEHTYAPGTHTASVKVNFDTDGNGTADASDKCTKTFTVEDEPETPIYKCTSLISEQLSRTAFKFTANAVAEGGAKVTKYVFDYADGNQDTVTTNATQAMANHEYVAPGDYHVTVFVHFDVNGQSKTQECQTHVTVEEEPLQEILTCQMLTVEQISRTAFKFTATAKTENGASIDGYTFKVNGATAQDNSSNVFSYNQSTPGDYTVAVYANGLVDDNPVSVTSNSCKKTITVEEEPEVPVYTCNALQPILNDNGSYTLTVSASASGGAVITGYIFSVNGDEKQNSDSNVYVFNETAAGTYVIKADVKVLVDGNNTTVTSANCEQTITVEPEIPVYECSALSPLKNDDGSYTLTVNAIAENGAVITGYIFSVNGNEVQNGDSNVYVFNETAAGTYVIKADVKVLVDGNNTTVTSANCEQTIVNVEHPIYECTALIANPSKITAGDKVTFTITTKLGGGATVNKYIYDFGDGSNPLHSSDATVSHVYDEDGSYGAKATVVFNVNDEQKEDSCATLVTVVDEPVEKPPEVLPNTGIAGVTAGFFGTGALAMSARSWLESRSMIRAGILKRKQ